MARGVDARDTNEIAHPNAYAARTIVRSECRQELHDLPIHVQRDQPLAIRVEVHHGARIVLDRAFQRLRRRRFEAEQHPPQRPDEQSFEGGGGEDRRTGTPRLTERRRKESTRSEADEQREQHARREERVEEARRLTMSMVRMDGVLRGVRMRGMSSMSDMTGVDVACMTRVAKMRRIANVSAVPTV